MTRLGVGAALVDGVIVPGDVDLDSGAGVVAAIGLDVDADADGLAVPGLVDLQVNGFAGIDFAHTDRDGYETAAMALAAHGAVAVQPTFHGCSIADYCSVLATLRAVIDDPPPGCRFLPAHLEGPFLSPTWRGAHDPATFVNPSWSVVERLVEAGPIGMMTMAPELAGALDLIDRICESGIVVSVGHTDATADVVADAVDAGARHITHLWNAHRRFAPRDPGPAGVALTDQRLTVGLIADLVHTSPEVVTMTARACVGRLAATTDAIAPAATDRSRWGSVTVSAGGARLADGTLAGSVATPIGVFANLERLGGGIAAAADTCGGAQRRLLGLADVALRPGDPADAVVVDEDRSPRRTLVHGSVVWSRPTT